MLRQVTILDSLCFTHPGHTRTFIRASGESTCLIEWYLAASGEQLDVSQAASLQRSTNLVRIAVPIPRPWKDGETTMS